MPNGMYGGVRGEETKVGQKTFVSRPTRSFFLREGMVRLLPDFIIASPKSEIQPVIGIDEVGYSSLLLGNAEGSFYNVVILRACNLNSNYRLGYPQGLIYRVWTSG